MTTSTFANEAPLLSYHFQFSNTLRGQPVKLVQEKCTRAMARLSGLQREVLALYRQCLREARKKPEVRVVRRRIASNVLTYFHRMFGGTSSHLLGMSGLQINSLNIGRSMREVLTRLLSCRSEFQEHIKLDKKDFGAIEYLLRKGQRQLEIYSSPGIRNVMR